MRRLRVIVAAGLILGTATACGGSSEVASPPASASSGAATSASGSSGPAASGAVATAGSSAAAAPAVVTIKDFAFAVPASVPAGATVQVTNDDGQAHTVTADSDAAFDAMVGGKATASFTAPTKPGRYPFHCTYHGNMHGVLVVS